MNYCHQFDFDLFSSIYPRQFLNIFQSVSKMLSGVRGAGIRCPREAARSDRAGPAAPPRTAAEGGAFATGPCGAWQTRVTTSCDIPAQTCRGKAVKAGFSGFATFTPFRSDWPENVSEKKLTASVCHSVR